jgi:hypothetical protein
MGEFKLCGPDNMCEFLHQRVLLGRGVAYKMNAKDNGLMINFCPFCGKRPGIGCEGPKKKSEAI